MSRFKSIGQWVDSRTDMITGLTKFMGESIPASTGWRNTLGSLAGALILVQCLTGFLLAMYYVPHPDAAHASLQYVHDELIGGSLIRTLHYQGTSFIVVALFIHMVRTFLSGTYRSPREATWISGLILLAITLALAFTGQLLPYNQMGYWAATVGLEIASAAPVLGPYIKQLLMGGDTVGALTITRFYALHVFLLPALLGLFLAVHLYFLRKHGAMRSAEDSSTDQVSFFPLQFFRDMVTITVGFALLFGVALMFGGPHSPALDLSDTTYVPIPEWYFNSHFEILRMTPPSLYVVATFVLPSVVGAALVLLPWLDRGKTAKMSDRKPVIVVGLLGIALVIVLTINGVLRNQSTHSVDPVAEAPAEPGGVDARAALGRAVFEEEYCSTCHRINGEGESKGPDLSHVGSRLQESYLRAWLQDPESFLPDTIMPSVQADGEQLDNLIYYLMQLK